METRQIRQEEINLINHLLTLSGLDPENYFLNHNVCDYEGGIMGSIGLGNEGAIYDGDIIQVKYIDKDNVPVTITLTKDTEDKILDLDFWKEDFSKLISYPFPSQILY